MAHKLPFDYPPIIRKSDREPRIPDLDNWKEDVLLEPGPQYIFQIRTEIGSLNVLAASLKEALDLFLRKQGHEPISIIRKDRVDYTAQ